MTEPESAEIVAAAEPIESPHVLWKQLAGFGICAGLLCYFGGAHVGLPLVVIGALAFADAWRAGIYKKKDSTGFLNISPMAWGIAMGGIMIVAYPVYVFNRDKLKTRETGRYLFLTLVVLGGAMLLVSLLAFLPPIRV